MSYILEALKKAQAERQLGSAPTIHAPAQSYAAPAAQGAGRRYAAIGVGAGVLIALAALWWTRQAGAPVVVAQAPAPAVVPAPATAPAPVAPVAAATAPPAAAPAARPAPAPAAPTPAAAPVAKQAAPTAPAPAPEPAPKPREALPARVADVPPAPPVIAQAAAPAEETVRTLQQLPEAIQREIPKVAFGGYIYSPDPAERLLLVDKMLRREGEEVAPGLVLERLLPKAAVMNYRGYRYRVAY